MTLHTLGVSSELSCLAIARRRKAMICGLKSGSLMVLCARTWQELEHRPPAGHGGAIQCIAISGGEERLVVAECSSVLVYALGMLGSDPVLGEVLVMIATTPQSIVSSITVLSDSSLLVATDMGKLQLYSAQCSSPRVLDLHVHPITCLEISHNEMHSFSGCQRVWDLATGQWEHEMIYKGTFFEGVICAMFSQDDRHIYTGSQDRSIKVWDVQNVNASRRQQDPNKPRDLDAIPEDCIFAGLFRDVNAWPHFLQHGV